MSLIIEWIRNMMFSIDKIIYAMISKVYDLLITIARTSPLSQADILAIADRIYKLLAIFMVFKVTFSLIMYVVNPDDFTDKSKGLGKLSLNIVLVFALLILTPHIFNMAYDLQRIVLEDNAIASLIFGEKNDKDNDFFTSAGDDMAYIAISPFFVPDVSIQKGSLYNCTTLLKDNKINESCSGISNDSLTEVASSSTTLYDLTKKTGSTFTDTMLKNYVTGINNKSLGMVFRKELVEAQVDGEFIMDYSYIVSTAVGVIILILLVNFCLDVSIRSIKFAFLQLIAPIPIISYIDPKSGKDGLFKKWTQLCVKTYLSLFIRLLALYFAVYIISMVGDLGLVDVVDSSYVTSRLILVIIIIGALMFAKQLPNILKDLGIKLDSDGFKLNPLRKIENEALGGKILKKPNDLLEKAGKAALFAPAAGVGLFGKKAIGAIDAARNGKGLRQGWKRTHGKLYNNINKTLDEWAPDRAEARKNERAGREEVAAMHSKWTKGKKTADKLKRLFPTYADKPWDALDGSDVSAYNAIYKDPEFIRSRMNLDRADAKNKILKRISEQTMRGSSVEEALRAEQKNIEKLDSSSQNDLFKMAGLKLDASGTLTLDDPSVTKEKAIANFTEMLDKTSKTVSGMETVHESIRKQNPTDAATEDALKHVKYNTTDPTDSSRKYS